MDVHPGDFLSTGIPVNVWVWVLAQYSWDSCETVRENKNFYIQRVKKEQEPPRVVIKFLAYKSRFQLNNSLANNSDLKRDPYLYRESFAQILIKVYAS